ncbi:DUF3098 domain-containing protein [Cryomorphaceae bacterium]|nr:DUF3098 domain-containing protein [Cryomorphaceae bacterium]
MEERNKDFIFEKRNYQLMIVGLVVMAIGYLLMVGGGSEDPEVFNPEIFSARRIVVSPTVIIIGFAIEIYAIMWRPKSKSTSE